MGGLLDVFQKAPGVYLTEKEGMPAPPIGTPKSLAGGYGVTEWGPMGSILITSFGQWKYYFGDKYISAQYPSYKQVKKFFQNGGTALMFSRIVHYTDPSDASTITAVKAVGYIFDGTPAPASRGNAVAGTGNTGDDVATAAGSYTGTKNGTYKVKVTTGGAFGVAGVTITFLDSDSGVESPVGLQTPSDGVAFLLSSGVSLALADGSADGLDLNDEWTIAVVAAGRTTGDQRIKVIGKYFGGMGNNITLKTYAPSNGVTGDFNLEVLLDGVIKEFYANLSPDANSENYFVTRVNTNSRFVDLEDLVTNVQDVGAGQVEALFGGDDGLAGLIPDDYKGDSEARTGVRAFGDIEYPMSIACWDAEGMSNQTNMVSILSDLIEYCDNEKKLFFAVLVVPKNTVSAAGAVSFNITTLAQDTTRGAMYRGWLQDEDDGEVLSPTGAILGVYADFSDNINKGVWWSPAGVDAKLKGFTAIYEPLTVAGVGVINENRVNAIVTKLGHGIVIWGSRTLSISQAAEYKYIGQRRNTSDLEALMLINSSFAVQRPNDPVLWGQIKSTYESILQGRFEAGGLSSEGGAPYEVKCDSTTNTREARQQGIVVSKVGIRNKETAEFVWIDVTQTAAGATLE